MCSVVGQSTAAHDRQDFGEAGRLLYEFFWFDFADWYIEASKARLYGGDAAAKRTAQRVLVYVLERSLRLWHPFLPFVTEQLWAAVPHTGASLMVAQWPEAGGARCATAEAQFESLKRIVGSVRNARSEYEVPLSKKVQAILAVEDEALRAAVQGEAAALCLLAKIEHDSLRARCCC